MLFLAVSSVLSIVLAAGSVWAIQFYKHADSTLGHVGHDAKSSGEDTVIHDRLGRCAKGICNYLVLGNDSRKGLSKDQQSMFGNQQTVPGQRSDTIMLVHVDARLQKAVVLSFPRDLWVDIPNQGFGKITSAYEGGPIRVAQVVSQLTGLEINHFLSVNLAGFENVVDALGGVPICIDHPLVDTQYSGLNLPHAGCYNLSAFQALAFVRARHVQCESGIPDFNRIGRQQQFLRAVLAKILSPGMVLKAPGLVDKVAASLLVDRHMNLADIIYLTRQLQGVSTGAVDFRSVPSVPSTVDTSAGVVDIVKLVQPDASELFQRLSEGKSLGNLGKSLQLTPPSPATIKVRVFDDASAGAALKVQDFLTKSGFDIQSLANSNTLGVSGPVILYKPDTLAQAEVVQGFLTGVPVKQAPKGALAEADVAVIIPASYAGSGVASPNPTATPSNPGAACG